MGLFITIFALGLVIFLHELGHMAVAKRFGIGVYEFSVGMGPKIWSFTKGETLYSLRLFPLGGFVKLAGLDDEENQPEDREKSYLYKPISQRAAVISAGSIMNLITGLVILILAFFFLGVPSSLPVVNQIIPDSPAAVSTLQAGDRIVALNETIKIESSEALSDAISGFAGTEVVLSVDRAGTLVSVPLTPHISGGKPVIGVMLEVESHRFRPIKSVIYGAEMTWFYIKMVFKSITLLISGQATLKEMAGPIGIVQFASYSLDTGPMNFIRVIAMISISLGVINLFPFPVLDGGHMVFLTLEAILRKPVSKKIEGYVNQAGALLLLSLMAFILFNDVKNWKSRSSLLNNRAEQVQEGHAPTQTP